MTDRPAADTPDCRHRRTTYNEQDGTLYCEQCHSWMDRASVRSALASVGPRDPKADDQ